MAPVSKAGILINDFQGLVTNTGPTASGEEAQNAAVQLNLVSYGPGEMTARPGLKPVRFDEDS